MPIRNATARWEGGLKGGTGKFESESGAVGGTYSFGSRFESAGGTNPEELLAAADAACYSMALSGAIERAGGTPEVVETKAACSLDRVGDGFKITTMRLTVRVRASGIDEGEFQRLAEQMKEGCPVSAAFKGNLQFELDATLER